MRVLIVASYNKNRYAPFIVEQAEALQKAGCEIEWFGVTRKGVKGYLQSVPELRAKIEEVRPDVIHAHYGLSCLLANLATRRVPVVSTYHGSDINVKSVRRFSKVAMWLSAWNIFVSKRTMEIALGGKIEEVRGKNSLIPCGINLPEPCDTLKNKLVEQLTLNEWVEGVLTKGKKHVLFAGAFDNAVKDPELAKAAVAYLNEKINIDKHSCADINIEDISKPKMNHPQSLVYSPKRKVQLLKKKCA